MKQKIIYIDMDETIADFTKVATVNGVFDHRRMYDVGFFLSLPVIDGALVAVRQLIGLGYDVQILSQPVADSSHSYTEKVMWIALYFPELLHKINLTQHKGQFIGEYLIDDNAEKWREKFEANGGQFITFPYHANHRQSWEEIVNFFKHEVERGKEKDSKDGN